MSSPIPWFGGMAGVVLAVAGAASALRAWEPDSAPAPVPLMTPVPTAATSAQPGVCPVDEAICDFAKRVEFEYREGDPTSLLSPKSEHYPEPGIVRAAGFALQGKPLLPRVVGIGCSLDPDGDICGQAFSLVLTAEPDSGQDDIMDRVLLGFLRDGDQLPIITINRAVGGGANPLAGGEDSTDCTLAGIVDGRDCQGVRFFEYSTGPEVAQPTPPPGPTPSGIDPLAGIELLDLKPGTQASIGYDTVVYYSPLGVGKGAPISKIFRAHRGLDGVLRTEELLERHGEQFGGPLQSIAVDFERGRMLVAACVTGQCGFEGSTPAEGAHFRMFESRDGGVTFEQVGELPASELFLFGFVGDQVLAQTVGTQGVDIVGRYFLYPSMEEVVAPPGLGGTYPYPDGAGGLVWRGDGGYYDPSGKLLISAGKLDVFRTSLPAGFLATWRPRGGNEGYVGLYDRSGVLGKVFRVHAETFMTGSQLPNGMLAGTIRFGEPYGFGVDGGSDACKTERPIYASLLNPETGAVHPIIELGTCENGHAGLHAVLARPFVGVVTGPDCLNVRAEPSAGARSLGCFADGVLLPVREATPADGWIAVTTPDGERAGWVAEEFLER